MRGERTSPIDVGTSPIARADSPRSKGASLPGHFHISPPVRRFWRLNSTPAFPEQNVDEISNHQPPVETRYGPVHAN